MKPEPIPATPDLMALLCAISAVMRGAVPVRPGMMSMALQLVLIGTQVPPLGALLKIWVECDEGLARMAVACGEDGLELHLGGHEGSGWLSRNSHVWRWRHVTRGGSALVIPVRWFGIRRRAEWLGRRRVWAPAWRLDSPFFAKIFSPVLALLRNCDLFVPGS